MEGTRLTCVFGSLGLFGLFLGSLGTLGLWLRCAAIAVSRTLTLILTLVLLTFWPNPRPSYIGLTN